MALGDLALRSTALPQNLRQLRRLALRNRLGDFPDLECILSEDKTNLYRFYQVRRIRT